MGWLAKIFGGGKSALADTSKWSFKQIFAYRHGTRTPDFGEFADTFKEMVRAREAEGVIQSDPTGVLKIIRRIWTSHWNYHQTPCGISFGFDPDPTFARTRNTVRAESRGLQIWDTIFSSSKNGTFYFAIAYDPAGEEFRPETAATVPPPADALLLELACNAVREQCKLEATEPLSPGTDLRVQIGCDELDMFEIVQRLDCDLNLDADMDDPARADGICTISDLVDYVHRHPPLRRSNA